MKLRNKKTGDVGICNLKIVHSMEAPLFYHSLAEVNRDWEDYETKEPLVKDEKIREAVRAWAEANSIKEIIIFDCGNNAPYTPVGAVEFAENRGHLKTQFRTEERFDTDRLYTIEELYGEEEECS